MLLSRDEHELLYWPETLGDPPALQNPPGRGSLRYRIGTYESWTRMMIHALMDFGHFPLVSSPAEVASEATFMSRSVLPASQRRRIRLNLSEEDNWILALVRSWATVGDVLSFYQERLIHEGYLRTAKRPLSITELARLLDYRPRPAVGGSAELAFTAADVEGLPRRVTVAGATAVTSVPPPGADPHSFETSAGITVAAEWNLMRPPLLVESAAPVLAGGGTGLELRGASLDLGAGAGMLIRGELDGEAVSAFRLLTGVETFTGRPSGTRISWHEPLADRELENLEVYALRRKARPFGHDAPPWADQPLAVRRCLPLDGRGQEV